MVPLSQIERALREGDPPVARDGELAWRAAVALVLREREGDVEVLMIRRAVRKGDPWSGHAALPGGRVDPEDLTLEDTAMREVREEVGVDLRAHGARVLGRLSDHPRRASRFATFAVTPVVVAIEGDPSLTLDPAEVADAHWVTLSKLPALRGRMLWWYRPWPRVPLKFPMLLPRWSWNSLTIWGLTHGILTELMHRADIR